MRFDVTLMMLAALAGSAPVHAQASQTPYDIMGTRVLYDPSGGCTIWFELTNSYNETLEVSTNVFVSTFDDITVGDAYLSFPPAVPGGKSRASANFYSFKLAGGDCPRNGFKFTVSTRFCEIVGSSYRLTDRACLFTKEFSYGKKPQ